MQLFKAALSQSLNVCRRRASCEERYFYLSYIEYNKCL